MSGLDVQPSKSDLVVADEEETEVGTFETLLRDVEQVERENDGLRAALREGRVRMGEFHALMMLDNMRLNDSRGKLETEFATLQKREEELNRRLHFLFDDCRRLSRDNDAIVAEAQRRDADLKEAERLLGQGRSVLKGAERSVFRAAEAMQVAQRALFDVQEQLHATRAKAVGQQRHRWEMEDQVAAMNQERAYLDLQLAGAPEAQLPPVPTALAREREMLAVPAEVRDELTAPCGRADCTEVRRAIADIKAELQRRADAAAAAAAAALAASTAGDGSTPHPDGSRTRPPPPRGQALPGPSRAGRRVTRTRRLRSAMRSRPSRSPSPTTSHN